MPKYPNGNKFSHKKSEMNYKGLTTFTDDKLHLNEFFITNGNLSR